MYLNMASDPSQYHQSEGIMQTVHEMCTLVTEEFADATTTEPWGLDAGV